MLVKITNVPPVLKETIGLNLPLSEHLGSYDSDVVAN